MNHTDTVKARAAESYSSMDGAAPGTFAIESNQQGLFYNCPCGCGTEGFLLFRSAARGARPSWDWDGDVNEPTLTPSVRQTVGCKWHGFLVAGEWRPCPDSGQ